MTTPLPTALDEPWHGTPNGYQNYRCRCEPCKKSNSDYRKKRLQQSVTGNEPWHGTMSGYGYWGCRCKRCKKIASAYREKRLEQLITGDESWHGTERGYVHRKCRCALCKKANRISIAARKYSLPKNVVEQILTEPVCSGCGKTQLEASVFHFDHDHNCCSGRKSCGKCYRGLLCQKCNIALGQSNNDPTILRNLANYLERYSA